MYRSVLQMCRAPGRKHAGWLPLFLACAHFGLGKTQMGVIAVYPHSSDTIMIILDCQLRNFLFWTATDFSHCSVL